MIERTQLLEDLFVAYYAARRHKRNTINQLRFELHLEREIFSLCDEILSCTYEMRPSICFIVDKPVKREIFAADFRDRVVHHLVYNYINPILETQFIDDSYSCRKGKGTLYGIRQLAHFVRTCSKNYTRDCYILKLDIQGYFMNIDKNILWRQLQGMLECMGKECKEYLNGIISLSRDYLSDHLHLRLHPLKIYLQHYAKGVKFLGAVVKPGRLLIAARTKKNFVRCLQQWDNFLAENAPTQEDLIKMRSSVNSYLGIMRHFKTFRLLRKLVWKDAHKFLQYGYLSRHFRKYKLRVNTGGCGSSPYEELGIKN